MRAQLLSLAILASLLGCRTPPPTRVYPDSYAAQDTPAEPYRAPFAAPHGGKLFHYNDVILEALIDDAAGAVRVYAYNEWGYETDIGHVNRAFLGVIPTMGDAFVVALYREHGQNYLAGRFFGREALGVRHSYALNLSFHVPDNRWNADSKYRGSPQCHRGHWVEHQQQVAAR